ncbi:MAG TPA: hypothetical protein V6C69_05325 [Trichormus sp.]
MNFNTVYSDLECPFCHQKVVSGVGFRFGAIANLRYHVGDKIKWEGAPTRPDERPPEPVVKTVGYFNCDNIRCSSWQDCYPSVQKALVTIENDKLSDVSIFNGEASENGFDIIEPKPLS